MYMAHWRRIDDLFTCILEVSEGAEKRVQSYSRMIRGNWVISLWRWICNDFYYCLYLIRWNLKKRLVWSFYHHDSSTAWFFQRIVLLNTSLILTIFFLALLSWQLSKKSLGLKVQVNKKTFLFLLFCYKNITLW